MTQEAKWASLRELIKVLKEMDMWTMDTKYLHIYLDTRFIDGDLHCTIRNRDNNEYLTIEELKNIRKPFNKTSKAKEE